nr:hypothetical protein [Tanacetum cinerariifolium]
MFAELARMGFEKPYTKLTFYKAFFLAQSKFLIHIILQCMNAKRIVWNEFSSSMASAVICLAIGFLQLMINDQVSDLSSHTTKYTSIALTQKVFANMRRVGRGFSDVDTPLFDGMLVQQQVHDDVADDVANTNDVVRLQALIDKRKVIITEDMIRQDLRLDDAENIDCLPNEEMFAELARMGFEKPYTKLTFYKAFFLAQSKFLIHIILQCMNAKRIVWNEFSSSMASAVICLAIGRKFNFLKYIFDSLVRNVDSSSKFYMYLGFLQLMINDQVSDLSSHTTKYTSIALTQKVFANMRRVGRGFSDVDTPLFDGMLVQHQVHDDVADDVANVVIDADAEPTPPLPILLLHHLLNKHLSLHHHKLRMHPNRGKIAELDADEDVTMEEVAVKVTKDADDDEVKPAELKEVIGVVTIAKLMTKVVTTVATTITATPMLKASATRRRKGVVIRDPEETATPSVFVNSEPKSKDKGKGILVKEPKPLKKQA